MSSNPNCTRVGCTACPWTGNRTYVRLDELSMLGERLGYGACPKCASALEKIQPKQPGVQPRWAR